MIGGHSQSRLEEEPALAWDIIIRTPTEIAVCMLSQSMDPDSFSLFLPACMILQY